jgi:hypothetical protein
MVDRKKQIVLAMILTYYNGLQRFSGQFYTIVIDDKWVRGCTLNQFMTGRN